MSNDSSLLRTLIREYLSVEVTRTDVNGNPIGTVVKKRIDPEAEDELVWFIDKYGRKPLDTRYRKTKGMEKSEKVFTADSSQQVDAIVAALLPKDPGAADLLKRVIFPWGQVGFDVLRRILASTNRTGQAFPFFKAAGSATVGGTIPFPKTPSVETVQFVMDARTRIGKNDTGKGELLLALLTGGVAGGPVGDLTIDGSAWEVKDARASSIRLGDSASLAFDERVVEWFDGWSEKTEYGGSAVAFLDALSKKSFVAGLPEEARSALDSAMHRAVEADGDLAGFVLVRPGGFEFYSNEDFAFDYRTKKRRVHIVRKS